jgi:hypothetical protein
VEGRGRAEVRRKGREDKGVLKVKERKTDELIGSI